MNNTYTEMIDLKVRLEQLKEMILLQEEQISENMSTHFGKTAKYVVFLSVSDGKSRATVCKGIGNSINTSWNNTIDILNKRIKELRLEPIWIKADIVNEIQRFTYEAFIEHISLIKTNYFRDGITFDSMMNIAFLEQEVNANVFFDENKEGGGKRLVWNNINFYIKNNLGMKYPIEKSAIQNVYTFTTIGFFHDGNTCYELNHEWLDNGRRYIQKIDENLVYSIIDKASDYLTSQVEEKGKFRYGYFPCFNKEVPEYNILRHASTTYSMIEAYEITKDESLERAIKSALEFLLHEGIEYLDDHEGNTRAFVIERAHDNEIKLGANAAAILAFSKYTKVFNDNRYIEVMIKLAEGIEYFQNKDDGSYVHVLNYPDLSIKEKKRVIYYDGEATFALLRLYDIVQDQRWLNIVVNVFEYFIQNKYWRHSDHWLSYCSNELIQYKQDFKYVEFNLKNAEGILDFCLTRETTYPTLLELLMATCKLLKKLKEENLYLDTLSTFDEEKLMRAIEHRVEHQLNGLFFPEVAMYYKVPENILWAFFIRHHSFRARIDDIEHNISGYCSYYHHCLPKIR